MQNGIFAAIAQTELEIALYREKGKSYTICYERSLGKGDILPVHIDQAPGVENHAKAIPFIKSIDDCFEE